MRENSKSFNTYSANNLSTTELPKDIVNMQNTLTFVELTSE